MHTRFASCCSVLILVWAFSLIAAQPDAMSRLDEALTACVSFEYGKNPQPLRAIEQIVITAAKDPQQRLQVEQRLLATLGAHATRDAKDFLCRQLVVVGSTRCIPPLEQMLADPALSHMAVYVLGRLEFPEALAAVHRATVRISGSLQTGLVNTLGERRYEPAVPVLAKLLGSADTRLAEAAATALGKIGTAQALKSLQAACAKAPVPVASQLDHAMLACADRLLERGDETQAAAVYRGLYASSQPRPMRIAALRGLVSTPKADALKLLVEAIIGPDRDLAASAIGFSGLARGSQATAVLAGLTPGLPSELQALMITTLGVRGDRAAMPMIVTATKSTNDAVRLVALEALALIGDGSVIDLLLQAAAAGQGIEAQVARAGLAHLATPEVGDVLIKALAQGDSKTRIEASRALVKRRATAAVGPLLKLATDEDSSVRLAGISALGDLAGDQELSSLVALLIKPRDPKDRPAIESAIESTFRRIAGPEQQAAPLLAGLNGAPPEARAALLRLLGKIGTPKALEAVRAGLKDDNATVREAALRSLADWPDATPARELLDLARSLESTQKLIALRGYIRLAGLSKEPTAMYARAMEVAQRTDDKRLVLAGLGMSGSADALQLVEQCLADESLRAEAGLAAAQIADRLRQRDATRARAALKHVLAVTQDASVRQKAIDVLNELDQFQDHILSWLGAGPFKQEGQDAQALFAMPFPPEQSDAQVDWKEITKGVGSWEINLDQAMGGGDDLAAYARARVWSPTPQDARLELGSDDGIKVWLNGKVVHANYTNRGYAPRQDVVKIRLQEGWNDLQLKVVNRSGGWGFACRVRQLDGTALHGLKFECKD